MIQLTDPAEICENAIQYLAQGGHLESLMGQAAFGSANPFRDVAVAEPEVWVAFCRAKAVTAEMSRLAGEKGHWWWGPIRRQYDNRTVTLRWQSVLHHAEALRQAAAWLREHGHDIDIDDELALREYWPGQWKGIFKDPKLSYLGSHLKADPQEAIADARKLLQRDKDRQAFEAGNLEFEEVHQWTGGTSYSIVVRK